jgi:hypothetical protein
MSNTKQLIAQMNFYFERSETLMGTAWVDHARAYNDAGQGIKKMLTDAGVNLVCSMRGFFSEALQ